MSGAVCAASYPDGRQEVVASNNGSDQYVQQMSDWYDLTTNRAASSDLDHTLAGHGFSGTTPEHYYAIWQSWRDWEIRSPLSWKSWIKFRLGWKKPDRTAPRRMLNDTLQR